jgi:cysteine-rich repeat protein
MAAPITEIGPRDGCCPDGGNGRSDPDCPSVCGNGVLEPDETCDPSAGECPVCVSRDPCSNVVTHGAAETCDVSCEFSPVEECRDDDGCCPGACNSVNDGDCVPRCGNSVLEAGERCEAGSDKPCDTACDDKNSCTRDTRTGSVDKCNLVCTHTRITEAHDADGCCPAGLNANDDVDCPAICGNRVVEPDEACDDGNHDAGDGCPEDCR